jgi:VanZ family protein
MYQDSKKIFDWAVVVSLAFLMLPSNAALNLFFSFLGEDTVYVSINLAIDILVTAIFLSLLFFLINNRLRVKFSAYIFLAFFFLISVYFLSRVQISRDRLHFLSYGILSLLLFRALRHSIATQMLYVWSLLVLFLFAVFDEVGQIFVAGRTFTLRDILIDCFSGLTGQLLIALVVRPDLQTVHIRLRRSLQGLKDLTRYQEFHKKN